MRRQVGLGGAETFAVLVRHLVGADALLLGAVEVVVEPVARLLAGFHEGGQKRIGRTQIHHVQRPALAVQRVGAALVVFGAFEVRQHVGEGPARVAFGGPGVVVLRVAARVDHGVDGAGAAQHLAAGLVTAPAVEARLGHGGQAPAVEFVLGHHGQPCRAVDEHALIGGAGFKQGHADLRVFAQARGQHTAGGTAAHDEVVVHVVGSPGACAETAGHPDRRA